MRLIKIGVPADLFKHIMFNDTYLNNQQAVKFAFENNLRDKNNHDIVEAMIKYYEFSRKSNMLPIENVLLERVSHSYSIYALSISTTPPAIRLKPTETARFCSRLFILSSIEILKFRILPL